MKRALGISLAVAFAIGAAAAPAAATQPDPRPDGFHKVWICHRTLSEANPFVVIPVDIETWDEDENGHNRPHNNAPEDFKLSDVVKGQSKPSAQECTCSSGPTN